MWNPFRDWPVSLWIVLRKKVTGKMDYDFVTERIAVGAMISSKDDLAALAAAGVTHVIDMRAEFDDDALLGADGFFSGRGRVARRVIWDHEIGCSIHPVQTILGF